MKRSTSQPKIATSSVPNMQRIAIANRGEIAVRIVRAVRELGLTAIVVYSDADRNALATRMADEAFYLGPTHPRESYLNIARILETVRGANVDAVHPGYGFLSENVEFAQAVIDAGLIWIGPHVEAMRVMSTKIEARARMHAAGVPVVPGETVGAADAGDALAAAVRVGFPVAIKASAGGGGRGMKIARTDDEVAPAFSAAQTEAQLAFGDGTLYIERYLEGAKHIEMQIVADKHGAVAVLGERDCSLQRRHQKLLEETPAQISSDVRTRLTTIATSAARELAYDSVGTLESLVVNDEVFFLEMNTRIQVEHAITEAVTGLDLVREQIRIAGGTPLDPAFLNATSRGHAIEVRINAEDVVRHFSPSPGHLTTFSPASGPGIRVDAAMESGSDVSPDYDSMIAKLIVSDTNREMALRRLERAFREFRIEGVPTTLPFLAALLHEPSVQDSTYTTHTLEAFAEIYREKNPRRSEVGAGSKEDVTASDEYLAIEVDGQLFRVRIPAQTEIRTPSTRSQADGNRAAKRNRAAASSAGTSGLRDSAAVVAPMPGVISQIAIEQGATVAAGDLVAVIEAMKMLNEIRAERSGTVRELAVSVGERVAAGTAIAYFTALPDAANAAGSADTRV